MRRDVTPGNILISQGDRAYLTDFGLIRRSKLETDLTKTGQFMGTVDCVAPEQRSMPTWRTHRRCRA